MEISLIELNTPAGHASTLIECPDKSLLVAWMGGSAEGENDVAIYVTRIADGQISNPVVAAKVRNLPHWNPVLHVDSENNIILFFKVGRTITHWKTWVMRSADSGLTWSTPRELVPGDRGGRGPVKNKCITLADGKIIAPASHENGRWRPFVDCSGDGIAWERSDYVPIERKLVAVDKGKNLWLGAIQPTLWESRPGQVHMLLRSNGGTILRSDSGDGGKSWNQAYETCLPSNNSGIDLTRLENGMLVLLCNPAGGNWAKRSPLSMFVSQDNGVTWQRTADLAKSEGDEYSYPAIISLAEGGIAFCFTWRRKKIAFGQLTAAELREMTYDKCSVEK